ncbi:UvrD-helicase domain-containing protein [Patescibacteria group bacterium]|nr:UvrD-helicase domain-containing protein [Patescibacteria group bacterium]
MSSVLDISNRGYVEAPAGCGKTYLIAETVRDSLGKYLILTHTHSGVQSLKVKLNTLGVSNSRFYIDTLSSFAYRYASAYPKISGMSSNQLDYQDMFHEVFPAAEKFFRSRHGSSILKNSYTAVLVDEYQDCSIEQHKLILAITEILPCIVFGDSLQAIFNFHGSMVEWSTHVTSNFDKIPFQNIPHRWVNAGSAALGEWLLDARMRLIQGLPLNINQPFINRIDPGTDLQKVTRKICSNMASLPLEETIAVLSPDQPRSRYLAQRLGHTYTSIEPIEAPDLFAAAERLDTAVGAQRAYELINFASRCTTKIGTELKSILKRLAVGDIEFKNITKHAEARSVIIDVARSDDPTFMINALNTIKKIGYVHRKDMYYGMIRALNIARISNNKSLRDAVRSSRRLASIVGRYPLKRVISYTLLLKGLEFDHVLITEPEKMSKESLYVALTRGARTLSIISSTNELVPVDDTQTKGRKQQQLSLGI